MTLNVLAEDVIKGNKTKTCIVYIVFQMFSYEWDRKLCGSVFHC